MKCTRSKIVSKIIKAIDLKKMGREGRRKIFENPKYNSPPAFIEEKYGVEKLTVSGRSCYTMSSAYEPKTHIIFLHGGAYRYPSTFFHWKLIENLLIEIPCEATFVDYPLAPEHKCEDNIRTVMALYKELLKNRHDQKIVLIGDSAGGGLALVMAQIIKAEKVKPKPDKIVMLSPWLDISMETYIPEELQECDYMLDRDQLKKNGEEYAGDLDTKHPLCSPFYGDSSDVGEMALFMGTQDILYVDAIRFKEKAKKENWDLTFYEYKDMQHDWVLFPMNDAAKALEEIVFFIEK